MKFSQINKLTILISFVSINFFNFKGLHNDTYKYIHFFVLFFVVLISLPDIKLKNNTFGKLVFLLIISILSSIVINYLTWGQSFFDSFLVCSPLFIIFYYFFLIRKTTINDLEQIIFHIGIIYLIIYFIQVYFLKTNYFGWQDEVTEVRGFQRLIMPGGGFFIYSFFFSVNNVYQKNKLNWKYVLYFVLGLIAIIGQVTRSMIVPIVLILLFHYLFFVRGKSKLIIFFLLLLLLASNINFLDGFIESFQSDRELGDNYIRVEAGNFFLFEGSKNFLNIPFGNSFPRYGVGVFGQKMAGHTRSDGYYLEDFGFITIFYTLGIFGILVYASILYKSIFVSLKREFYHNKYYIWYLFLSGVAAPYLWDSSYLVVTVFTLVMFQKSSEIRKSSRKNISNLNKLKIHS